MPLTFPPAPTAFFKRANEPETRTEMRNEPPHSSSDGLRLYPLNPGRAVRVEPLSRPNLPPHKMAPLQHLLKPIQIPQMQQQMQQPPQMQQPQRPMHSPMPPMPQFAPPMQAPQPPQFPQMQPPPYPTEQLPPEKAAEQFRRMNKTLPDGVRYEPLDDDIMKILREKNPGIIPKMPEPPKAQEAQKTQEAMPTEAPPTPQKETTPTPQPFGTRTPMIPVQIAPPATEQNPSPVLPPRAKKILKRLAHEEYYSSVLYANFAEREKKEPFTILARDSKIRLELYTALLAENFKENFTPKEAKTQQEIPNATALAIFRENKSLTALANLIDTAADTPAEKQLTRLLHKKIIGHQLLLSFDKSAQE
ncbi:MAG: hypothetical protein FWB96_12480 [Defluviitaleaceae bacterium]|nr:hypothetical protein [Defluviitaleaceae bacterium]MCL2264064.1 hypothetical protein [Defluviitaleaceae bacterium]